MNNQTGGGSAAAQTTKESEDKEMKYTEYGLMITLEELRKMLEVAECEAEYHNMEHAVYIKGDKRPQILQYCCYAECTPVNHTALAR